MSSSQATDHEEEINQDEFKVKFVPIPETQTESYTKVFTSYKDGLVKAVPGGMVAYPRFGENAENVYKIKPRKDDAWLLSFPKTGKYIQTNRRQQFVLK